MKWLTKVTIENNEHIEEYVFKSDSKRDYHSTFLTLRNRYNGFDYSSTHIEDYCGNIIAVLKNVNKIDIDELKWNIIAAIFGFGVGLIAAYCTIDLMKNW